MWIHINVIYIIVIVIIVNKALIFNWCPNLRSLLPLLLSMVLNSLIIIAIIPISPHFSSVLIDCCIIFHCCCVVSASTTSPPQKYWLLICFLLCGDGAHCPHNWQLCCRHRPKHSLMPLTSPTLKFANNRQHQPQLQPTLVTKVIG